jgi:F-type H+-transporting ATPase subunit b
MSFSWTTFLFEVVNFLILLWLLQRVIFKPLKRGIDERRKAIEERAAESEARLLEAERVRDEVTVARDAIEEERSRVLREAEEEAAADRARLLEIAREDAETERHRAARALDLERAELLMHTRELAIETSVALAAAVLQKIAPEALHAALSERLIAELDQHPTRLTAESGDRAALAVPVGAGEGVAEPIRARLAIALGRAVAVDVEEDPELIAGARLRLGDYLIDASLVGQLESLEALALERIPEAADA